MVISADGTPSMAMQCNDGTVRMFALQPVTPDAASLPPLINIKSEPEEQDQPSALLDGMNIFFTSSI